MTTMTTTRRPGHGRAEHAPLAIAVAIAGGTLAYADPVRFDNDGSFDWHDNLFLDITKGASKQVGALPGPGTFLYYREPPDLDGRDPVIRGGLTTAQTEGGPVLSVRGHGAVVPNDFASPYGQSWNIKSLIGYYYANGFGFRTEFDTSYPREPGYVAARFQKDGATHYGWMSLQIVTSGPYLRTFELLAWGYEREPNTPIEAGAVPAPSAALLLLAFGAAAGMTRARRA